MCGYSRISYSGTNIAISIIFRICYNNLIKIVGIKLVFATVISCMGYFPIIFWRLSSKHENLVGETVITTGEDKFLDKLWVGIPPNKCR